MSDVTSIEAFFDSFVSAFATFDAAKVATHFIAPGVAHRRDGSLVPLTTMSDVERYYRGALDRYRDDGCTSCPWEALETVPMGSASLLAAVTWRLLRADASPLTSWRQSYALSLAGGSPKIFASSMHAT